jgi:hypothetical protein
MAKNYYKNNQLCGVIHNCNPSTGEAEVEESRQPVYIASSKLVWSIVRLCFKKTRAVDVAQW